MSYRCVLKRDTALEDPLEAQDCRCSRFTVGRVSLYDYCNDFTADLFRGGMRGIVELEALKAIENELGGKIPARLMFDMVAGTR